MDHAAPPRPARPQQWSRWRGGTIAFGPRARIAITLPLVAICSILARATQVDFSSGYWVGVVVNLVWLIPSFAFSVVVLREVWAPHRVG